jgi:2-oxoglutarate dehydrogenase E2 component (dihydrolipoamide succinyltransferase)
MKKEIKVPSVGESVTQVTIGSFLKKEGAFVQKDEEIVEIETDKVNQVLFAPESGSLSWSVREQETVDVGAVIGFVDTEGKGETKAKEPKESEAPKQQETLQKTSEDKKPTKDTHQIKEKEEEYLSAKPEEKAVSKKVPAPEPKEKQGERREPMTKIRKVIGKRLLEVKQKTAMLTTFNEVDMSQVMALRAREKENFQKKYGVKLGFTAFFVKAVVAALQEYPDINAFIEEDSIVFHDYCDIGVAVGTDKGLMVPVIKGAHNLTLTEIELQLKELADKAKKGTISADKPGGGTFTITNGGVYGSMLSTPILNPPQSGILGLHNIEKRAVVIEDQIVIRPMMYLALSYDHRIVDGKESISFLMHIKRNIEDPTRFILDL